jgi:N-acyl amino acid synthase of PEP-CTERM/exosortase system
MDEALAPHSHAALAFPASQSLIGRVACTGSAQDIMAESRTDDLTCEPRPERRMSLTEVAPAAKSEQIDVRVRRSERVDCSSTVSESCAKTHAALSGYYNRYFAVVPANTPDLVDAAHALRYQVYCVEHAFEDRARQIGQRERDRYDDRAVQAVLIYKPASRVVGCIRLVLPSPDAGIESLPIHKLLDKEHRKRLDQCDPARSAEISRYAVSKEFRRRRDEEFFPDVHVADLPANEFRRLLPYMSLGLLRGVSSLAADQGITTVCAAMAPALLRLLERFGLIFQALGPLIDHHGLRQPCLANCEALLAGMAARHAEYYELLEAAYHGRDLSPAL